MQYIIEPGSIIGKRRHQVKYFFQRYLFFEQLLGCLHIRIFVSERE